MHYITAALSLITSSALVCAVPLPRQETCASLQVLYAAGTFEAGLGTTGLALKSAVTSLVSDATVDALVYNTAPEYLVSVSAAAKDASDTLTQMIEACPGAKLALVGYSKGAMVAHEVQLDGAAQDALVAAATFGDLETVGTGSAPPRGDLPVNNADSDIIAFCNEGDPFCDGGANIAAHLAYLNDGSTDQAASFIVDRFKAATK